MCWVYPPSPEVSSSFEDSTPWETSAPIEPTPTSGDGSGTGSSKVGIIAGVVVAVLILIIVIVILLIILWRRRKDEMTEGEAAADEFTEETMTTLTDEQSNENAGDWSQTQDNPLFASENFDDDDDFAANFEETG